MAAADHIRAQNEGRESYVQAACRWVVDKVTEAASQTAGSNWRVGSSGGRAFEGAGPGRALGENSGGFSRGPVDVASPARLSVPIAHIAIDQSSQSQQLAETIDVRAQQEENPEQQEVCAICRDSFLAGDVLMRLECLHEYHEDCISSFISSAVEPSCPSCRFPVTAALSVLPVRVLHG